ncbi:ferritin light chain isoform X2 [Procambarus clarkii]|uniref:ferritin light chain isoform X2 n=1 Tax=Procambarus clarkii TaxID=6728 RepID=UPI001E6776B1|nr:uncharacterized protein LOC123755343 isoform X2 [Procambarus clarkii]
MATKMHLLLATVCALLLTSVVVCSVEIQPTRPLLPKTDIRSPFIANHTKLLMELMETNFDYSLSYLFSSKQYGSQYIERPGMSKFLMEASDKHWKEGFDVLQKFLQRGGNFDDVSLSVKGKGYHNLTVTGGSGENYVNTLEDVLENCQGRYEQMNKLCHKANKSPSSSGDAEIAHYLEEKLEDEAKRLRELYGHIVTLKKMKSLGVALNMFDSNL